MPQNINGYLLVKDKDGQLKYYKDGKFFSLEEVQKKVSVAAVDNSVARKKVTLKPILRFEDKQKTAAAKLPEAPRPVASLPVSPNPFAPIKKLQPIAPRPSVSPARPEPEQLASGSGVTPLAHVFDLETLEHDEVGKNRRIQDKELVFARTQEVIEKLKIQFTDEQIKNRFTNILHTYFRGIRGKAEVEYMLTLSRAAGGLELPKEKAEIIVSLLTQHSEATNKERRDIVVKPKEKIIPVKVEEKQEEKQSAPPLPPVAPQKQMIKPEIVRPTTLVQPNIQTKVGDVKLKNKLVGPIEELTYMTLDDFRRIGRNIDEIVSALLEKIQLLADESLARKVQGIKAWKQSPVFMLYLSISMQGILQGKTMEQVIIDKQRNHEDCLTLSEFEAISRLNSQLVY